MVKAVLEDDDLFVVGTQDGKYDGGYKPTVTKASVVANYVISKIPATPYNFGLFAQTAQGPLITNTTVESSIIGNGVGTLTIPANGFQIGDSFRAKLTGHISAANNNTIDIKIKAGSILLADTGVVTLPNITNLNWTIEVDFTVRALGAAGIASIVSSGVFTYMKNASNAFEGDTFSIVNSTTFDTTLSNTLNVTVIWGTASPSNIISTDLFTLTKTY
jgi:hypothetical protein